MLTFSALLGRTSATISLGKCPSENFRRYLQRARFFHSSWWKYELFLALCELQGLFCSFLVVLSPAPNAFLTCVCWSALSFGLEKNLCVLSLILLSSPLLLCTALSLWYSALWTHYIGLPKFSPLQSPFRETTGIYLCSSSFIVAWNLSRQ